MIRVDKQLTKVVRGNSLMVLWLGLRASVEGEGSVLVGELRFSKLHRKKKQKTEVAEYKISIPKSALFLCTSSKQTENWIKKTISCTTAYERKNKFKEVQDLHTENYNNGLKKGFKEAKRYFVFTY